VERIQIKLTVGSINGGAVAAKQIPAFADMSYFTKSEWASEAAHSFSGSVSFDWTLDKI
jgi:hypothetical protein